MIYGPTLQEAATSADSLNTSSATIYNLFSGALNEIPDDRLPFECDVRGETLISELLLKFLIPYASDVAKAHILALKEDAVEGKRIILCGGAFTWKDVSDTSLTHWSELDYFLHKGCGIPP